MSHPGVLETTADTLFALIMATSRRIVELANHVKEGRWVRNIEEDLFGWDVHGKTLGIVGFGRIGQALAEDGPHWALACLFCTTPVDP